MTEDDQVIDVPEPPMTGDVRVDAATGGLAVLATKPVAEHVEAYEDVHRQLHEALSDLDTADPDEPTAETAAEPRIQPPAAERAS